MKSRNGELSNLKAFYARFVLLTLVTVTVIFTPSALDPFSLPKSLLLYSLSAACIPIFVFVRALKLSRMELVFATSLVLFLLVNLISAIHSLNPINGFFGEYGRNNGFLTYLALATLAITIYKSEMNPRRVLFVLAVLNSFLGIYGILQFAGFDWVNWNNPFNPVITTFGNPNFAAAHLSIGLASQLYFLFWSKSVFQGAIAFFGLTASLLAIFFSRVTQALVILVFVFGAFVLFLVWKRSVRWFFYALGLNLTIVIVGVLGLFKVGPLADVLGKSTFTYRTDYWYAAWRMFLDRPWLGVGPDQYGNYFQEFRSLEQIQRNGPEVMANNAHNVFLHILATAGIFGFVTLIIIALGVLFFGTRNLKKLEFNQQKIVVVMIISFAAYLIQASVSIDHIGLALWGWTLGSLLMSYTIKDENMPRAKSVDDGSAGRFEDLSVGKYYFAIVLSLFLLITVSFFSLGKHRGDVNINATRIPNFSSYQESLGAFLQAVRENSYDPQYLLVAAKVLRSDFREEDMAIDFAKEVLRKEPRSFDAWNLLAGIYEERKEYEVAIPYRLKTTELDPYNFEALYTYALDLKAINDQKGYFEYGRKALSYTPETEALYSILTNEFDR